MNISFENQAALITGAGSGIGLATAQAFAEAGAAVALADLNHNTVQTAADQLTAAGHQAIAAATSPTRPMPPKPSNEPSARSVASMRPTTTPAFTPP